MWNSTVFVFQLCVLSSGKVLLVAIVIAALAVIASGFWVATALVRAIRVRRPAMGSRYGPGDKSTNPPSGRAG